MGRRREVVVVEPYNRECRCTPAFNLQLYAPSPLPPHPNLPNSTHRSPSPINKHPLRLPPHPQPPPAPPLPPPPPNLVPQPRTPIQTRPDNLPRRVRIRRPHPLPHEILGRGPRRSALELVERDETGLPRVGIRVGLVAPVAGEA